MSKEFFISITPSNAAHILDKEIVNGSITGECIDRHHIQLNDGYEFIVLVFEKHYYRAGNRLTLTVCLDNLTGYTRVHSVSGGGGEGLFSFDWGASEDFSKIVYDTLVNYKI